MMAIQNSNGLQRSFGVFILWVFLNSFLWFVLNTLVGYINYGLLGFQTTNNPVGFISGIIVGSFVGLIQWLILSRNFSVSPLWILSCAIGFSAHYTINWIAAASLMGVFQQFLIKRKINDSFLWLIAVFISMGLNGERSRLVGESDAIAFICFNFFFFSTAYGLPTGLILGWFKYKSVSQQEPAIQQGNM